MTNYCNTSTPVSADVSFVLTRKGDWLIFRDWTIDGVPTPPRDVPKWILDALYTGGFKFGRTIASGEDLCIPCHPVVAESYLRFSSAEGFDGAVPVSIHMESKVDSLEVDPIPDGETTISCPSDLCDFLEIPERRRFLGLCQEVGRRWGINLALLHDESCTLWDEDSPWEEVTPESEMEYYGVRLIGDTDLDDERRPQEAEFIFPFSGERFIRAAEAIDAQLNLSLGATHD